MTNQPFFHLRNIPAEIGQIQWPHISVCLDPPTTVSRLSSLGLSELSWNNKQFRTDYNESIFWPITSENNTDLFDRSMFSFEEVFGYVMSHGKILKMENDQNYKVRKSVSWKGDS